MKGLFYGLFFALCLSLCGCGPSKKLLYKDDWEGRYTLVEYNCCGDEATKVKLEVLREKADYYRWKLFWEGLPEDTIAGRAVYQKNKLKFYVENEQVATKYFTKSVTAQSPVFWMEYQFDKDYYTWWYNDLKNYRRSAKLFAGIDYHFRQRVR